MNENKEVREKKVSTLGLTGLYYGTILSTTLILDQNNRNFWANERERIKNEITREIRDEFYQKLHDDVYEKLKSELCPDTLAWEKLEHPKDIPSNK